MSLFAISDIPAKARDTSASSPTVNRLLLLAAVAIGAVGAIVADTASPVIAADADLVGLLRFMALLKAALALAFVGVIWWRLASPAGPWRLAAYAATGAAMTAGPILIWTMSHLGLGAALLHAGLLAAALLLWRDPAVTTRLSALVPRRHRG